MGEGVIGEFALKSASFMASVLMCFINLCCVPGTYSGLKYRKEVCKVNDFINL